VSSAEIVTAEVMYFDDGRCRPARQIDGLVKPFWPSGENRCLVNNAGILVPGAAESAFPKSVGTKLWEYT
jgi:hypothetical protein